MAIPTEHVQPGDLIRADLLNAILDALEELDSRVSALEGASPPGDGYPQVVITGVSPTTPHEGDTMTITGRNFDFGVSAAVVRFGSVIVPSFKAGSSDSQLVFAVPNLGITSPTGQVVTMTVSNFATTTTRSITVLPKPQIFQGTVDLEYVSGSTLTAGSTAIVRFKATSTGSPAVTVALAAQTSTGWSGLQILDNQTPPQPIEDGTITIPALGQVAFSVGVPIPAGTPSGTPFDLTVTAEGQGVTSQRVKQLSVGSSAPVEDPTITKLDIRSVVGGSLTSSGLAVPRGGSAELTIEVVFTQADDYDVTVALDPASTQWTLETDAPAPTSGAPSYTIEPSDLVSGVASRTFLVGLSPKSSASDEPRLHVVAKHTGGTLTRDLLVQLGFPSA